MQSGRALRMMPAITELCVGPALVAEPQFIGETARRQAAALHSTASLRLRAVFDHVMDCRLVRSEDLARSKIGFHLI